MNCDYAFAQRSTSIQGQQTNFNKFANNVDRTKQGEIKNFVGEYYLSEKWEDGVIYANSNIKIENVKIRYCVFNQEFHFINKNDTMAIQKPLLIDSIKYNQNKFIYSKFMLDKRISASYFELLNTNEIKLLRRYESKFIKGKKNVSSFEEPTEDKFIVNTKLYLQRNGEPAVLLPKRKSKFLEIIGTKKADVDRFIKANKLKLSKVDDIQRILKYYSSIY